MKKFFFLFAITTVAFFLQAEIWFNSGMVYRMAYDRGLGPKEPNMFGNVIIGEDTIVNGTTARPVYCKYDNIGDTTLRMFIDVSHSDKVYYLLPEDGSQWKLLYDFSLTPGDTCICYGASSWEFNVKCDSIIEDYLGTGLSAKIIKPNDDFYQELYSMRWIEGIGSDWGLMENCMFDIVGGGSKILYVDLDGKRIFTSEGYSSIENVRGNQKSEIYNLQGQRLTHPKPGINIINGRLVRY